MSSSPKSFDLTFIDAMIPHHQSAIDAAVMVQESAVNPQIRELAQQIIGTQQQEIEQMNTWREQWYPDAAQPSTGH